MRDNSEFKQFRIQTGILSEETASNLGLAQMLVETNQIETISDGDYGLLESFVLKRESTFILETDSLLISSGLNAAVSEAGEVFASTGVYTLLLEELTEETDISFKINSASGSYAGLFSAAVAVLVEHGAAEHDSEVITQAMETASPVITTLSEAMAQTVSAAADAVQAAYADMAARRQRTIVTEGYPRETVEELAALNHRVTTLLVNLRILHDGWLALPAVHSELVNSLTGNSTSVTLIILAEKLKAVRESGGEQ